MSIYGQFCPISKAAEVLGERWTLLVIRELMMGSSRFNQLQRGVAKMSPSLLTKRLRELEQAQLIHRIKIQGQKGYEYHLTESGKALQPMIAEMAKWGMQWVYESIDESELDVELLMQDIHRSLKIDKLPSSKSVFKFHFTDIKELSDWWVLVDQGLVDLCTVDPGYEPDLYITSDVRSLMDIWVGNSTWPALLKSKKITLLGNTYLEKSINAWMGSSYLSELNPKMSA